jgi:transposase
MDELRCLEFAMSRLKKDPLRPLTDDELAVLTKLSRSKNEAATRVARASLILAVARGCDYQQAAESIGRRSGDAVSHLVARFNAEGTAALDPRHGGGRAPVYDPPARERIIQEARRRPTPEADGTASWSLTTLRKALRSAPDGLPKVSTYTIGRVLHQAGASPQKDRSWCPTGTVLRKRKSGTVVVTDPDTTSKKS